MINYLKKHGFHISYEIFFMKKKALLVYPANLQSESCQGAIHGRDEKVLIFTGNSAGSPMPPMNK